MKVDNRTRRISTALALLLVSLCGVATAQPATQQAPRKSFRPDVDRANPPTRPEQDQGVTTAGNQPAGDTYVALASGLERVYRGYEPQSVESLRLLQEQQARVVEVIEKVTVNVQQGSAQGSGVVITASGYILTAAHVAGRPGLKARVYFSDGRNYDAITLGMNRDMDAGLMRIVGQSDIEWPHATIGRVIGTRTQPGIREGQWCIAAGYPGGWYDNRGVVVRVGRILRIMKNKEGPHTLKTDCALIGGDSGGPLFGLDGRLIGIHSRIGSDINDNMHVPINVYSDGWERMLAGDVWGTLPGYRPVIGVRGIDGSSRAAIEFVTPGGPAAKAGMQAGDVVVSVNKKRIDTFAELQAAVIEALPGDVLTIIVVRSGQNLRLKVRVAAAG
ncbi:MAG: trypsin-like peptidase domain-containing protein [Aureliella sp.]